MSFCFPYPHLPILTLRSPQAILNCSLGVTKHYKAQAVGRYAFVLHLRIIDVTRFTGENEARVKKVRSIRLHNCLTLWTWWTLMASFACQPLYPGERSLCTHSWEVREDPSAMELWRREHFVTSPGNRIQFPNFSVDASFAKSFQPFPDSWIKLQLFWNECGIISYALHAFRKEIVRAQRQGWTISASNPGMERDFSLLQVFQIVPRFLQHPIKWILLGSFPWVKRPRRDVDHSPPPSAVTWWHYTDTPSRCLYGMARDNLTLYAFYMSYFLGFWCRVVC